MVFNEVINDLQCSNCLLRFETFDTRNIHIQDCCNNKKLTKIKRKKRHDCDVCGDVFKSANVLEKHRVLHNAKYPFTCKICLEHFKTAKETKVHHLEKHSQKFKKLKCKLCPELVFVTKELKSLHMETIHKGLVTNKFMCSDCGKQFKTRSELTHHIKSKCGTVKLFKCKECGQCLMNAGSLHNHMLRHTGKRSHMCDHCGKMFLTPGQLKVHKRTHTQEKPFVCTVCNKGFCHRQSLITHSTLHTGVKPFECENCSHSFSCVGNLIKHRRTHPATCGSIPLTTHRVNNPTTKQKIKLNTPENCKLTAYNKEKELQAKSVSDYRKSFENSQEETNKWDNGSSNLGGIVLTNDCVEKLCNGQSLQLEVNLILNGNGTCDQILDSNSLNFELPHVSLSLPLEYSAKKFDNQIELDVNENSNYLNECNDSDSNSKPPEEEKVKNADLDKKKFKNRKIGTKCNYCDRIFTNKRSLHKHEIKHRKQISSPKSKPSIHKYKCKYCTISFEHRDFYNLHLKTGHADILTCQQCVKVFAKEESLRSHINTVHQGQLKKVYIYVCNKCGLQFRQKASLVYHENNNCGEGPSYKCDVCGKSFSSIHILKSHLKVHDPKKTFLCKFCGKGFRWKGQLKIHERSHTGEKPFKCLHCPKAFAYRESLMTHSTIHTGVKPHICRACGSRFSCIGNLIKHRVTHASSCGMWDYKNK